MDLNSSSRSNPAHSFAVSYAGALCLDTSQWRPRQDSNLRHRLRRAVLYPLSYGGESRERS